MTVPVVVSTSPVDGVTNVPITSDIVITFNTPIDEDTVHKATIVVYRTDTYDLVDGSFTVDSNIVTYRPARRFYEDVSYTVKVVGDSESSPGGCIESESGDPIEDPYTFSFTTEVKRYATLEEAEERADVTHDGPIRVETLYEPGGLALMSVSPRGFSSGLDPSTLDRVVFTFSAEVDSASITSDVLSLSAMQVFDDADYYGRVSSNDGLVHLQVCDDTLDYSQPTGTFVVTGTQIIWQRGTGEPTFNYNSQVAFMLGQGITDTNGQTLLADTNIVMTTEYFPRFVSPQILRAEMGPALANQFDDAINRLLFKNSVEAWEQTAYVLDLYSPYPAAKRWVRHKTVVDLVNMISSQSQLLAGQRKVLGDLQIVYPQVPITPVSHGLLASAQKGLDMETIELRAYRGQGMPTVAIKGIMADGYAAGYRRWDIEYQSDNIFYSSTAALIPASNLEDMRLTKLELTMGISSSASWYFGTVRGTTGLFTCPNST